MPEDYTVQQGDCISSIAFSHGFFWQTLWNDGANSNLKSLRKDPNVLKEGDVVHIPDLRLKQESCATEKRWSFKLKGVPAKCKIKVLRPPKSSSAPPQSAPAPAPDALHVSSEDPDPAKPAPSTPWANAAYYLVVDGKVLTGHTNGDGVLEVKIPPNAQKGTLTMERGAANELSFDLTLGALAPYDTISGAKQRLYNLGYDCGGTDDNPSPAFAAALTAFQTDSGLSATGELDDNTKNKLKEVHGS
jgi:hypothetical protein